jgi:hypothetical protein
VLTEGLPSPADEAALAKLDTNALAHELAAVLGDDYSCSECLAMGEQNSEQTFCNGGIDGRRNRLHGLPNLHSSSTRRSSRACGRVGKVA